MTTISNRTTATVQPQRLFAVIPAAGLSRRMGTHKLLLQLHGETLIKRLLRHLPSGDLATIHILIRPDDAALHRELDTLVADMPIVRVLIAPAQTADMKASVELLLRQIAVDFEPGATDGWLLIPADHPNVQRAVLDRVIAAWRSNPEAIVVASHKGRRGHPVIFPWRMASQVSSIPDDRGLNWLLQERGPTIVEVDCPEAGVLCDLDTPEDLARWHGQTE